MAPPLVVDDDEAVASAVGLVATSIGLTGVAQGAAPATAAVEMHDDPAAVPLPTGQLITPADACSARAPAPASPTGPGGRSR